MQCKATHSSIRFRDAFGNDLLVAFLVTTVSTVLALISKSIEEEIIAKSAKHELIELPLNEFVTVHFVNLALAFPDSTLTPETT